jgi:flagellar protein FlaG
VGKVDIRAVEASTASIPTSQRPQAAASRSSGVAGDSHANVREIVKNMQSQLDSMNVSLQYRVYGENDEKIAIRVVNRDTGDVIREFPPKEMQALQAKMSELVGMIFNDNA